MGILDDIARHLTPEAGQARRRWVNRQGQRALDGIGYVVGPDNQDRVESAVRLGSILNPVEGVSEAMQGGRQAYEGEGWDRVAGVGRAASGVAGTVAPLAIAGTGAADDAARAVSEALLGWSPAKQGAADEIGRLLQDESGAFAGINARTADLGALDTAKKMLREGADRDAIWNETGWFRGVDGKWRFEIDDSLAEMDIVGAASEVDPGTKLTLGEVMNHSALFDAYPEIAETPTYLATAEQLDKAAPGAYGGVTKGGSVVLRDDIIDTGRPMHEVMHLIQRKEGFPTGGSPVDLGDEAYRNLPGELEAELVNLRASLTPEMRRQYPPWSMSPNPWESADPAVQRGQEILDMLAAGRGSEVTDDMLDLGDPTLNTRLNQYLFANYDLPMDEASRMARAGEMGFDTGTSLYHGTGADFTAVDPFRSRGMDGGEGVFTAEDPYTAGSYADLASDYGRPQIQPLIGREGRRASHVYADFEGAPWNTFGPETDPSRWGSTRYSGEYDPFGWQDLDMDDWAGEYVTTDDIARVAREDGFSGARFYDVEDHVSGDDLGATNVRVDFDPTNIRSRFARFDPRLAHLRNLSAGMGGLAALNYATPSDAGTGGSGGW